MLRVGVCGGVIVEVDGRRQADRLLAGRQGRLVLAYLVCERHRSVSRDELAELVWGERLPSSWASSLSAVISKLRRLFSEAGLDGPAVLASAFGSYRLHLAADTWVDWEVAHAAVAAAEQALAAGDTAAALSAAADAEDIARRGFHTDDCEWVDAQRQRLRDLRVQAAHVTVQAHLMAGERHKAVAAANTALELDDRREASYRLLMGALAAAGERGEALRVWERCRIMLAEELGSDPAPETEAMYLSLLGDAGPAAARPDLPTGVVTFLLTDIVDSTVMWERHPAAMAITLERHDSLIGEAITAHGGTLLKAKLEGDATISVFPRATAGVLAALELSELLAAEEWPPGAAPAVRTALHTGEAIERDGDYFGPALNRAARLRGMSGGGQIVVSQAVAEVVRDHLPDGTALHSLGEHQLKGLSRAEHVYELVPATSEADTPERPADTSVPSRPALAAILARGSPFVGREAELAKLEVEWATALAGTPRAVLVAGEPGVGKTRLAAEWARSVYEQGGLVLYGRCDEELGAPYQPFAEALRSVVPHLGPARLRAIRGVEDLARLTPELRDLIPGLAGPTQADPDTERYLLFDALARLLEMVSRAIPVLVVVDDLHWAAKPTLLMLRHLLRSADGTRLQIVGTYRSTDLDRSHPLAAALADLHSDGATERVALSGLDAGEVSAYLSAAGYHDSQLGKRLAAVTSGNPFFLIEVLRHVDESGGHWTSTNLPQGVREAVSRRLSRLSETANEALQVGAVAGSRFALGLVEEVTGRDLVEPIDEARRAGLVVEEPNGRFRFDHALVRQSLLAELASVKRVRLHQRIAAALEADPFLAGDAPLADLARHWFECAYAGGAAKAVDYSRQAAEEATVRLAYEEAAQFYDQAVQASGVEGSGCDDDTVAELLLAQADALLAAGDPTAVGPVLVHLDQVAHGSPRLSAWRTCYAAQLAILIHPEQLEAAASETAGAAEKFASLSDAEGEAKAHTVRAGCLARLGRIADCEAALDRALTAGRQAGNPRLVNGVLAGAPVAALWGPSPVARASGRCLDVVRVLRITTGSPAVEAVALRCQAVLEALRDRPDASRRMLATARLSLEGLGHVHGLLETDVFDGLVDLCAGEPAGAEIALRRAYDGFSARGVGVDAAQAAALLARAVLAQGRVDEAIALTHDAERLAGDDLKAAIAWRAARAEALAEQGSIADALEAARAAVALADATDALIDQADAHLALAVVQRAAGDTAASQAESHRAMDLYERKGAAARVEAVRTMFARPVAAESAVESGPIARRRVPTNLAFRAIPNMDLNDGSIAELSTELADGFVLVDHRFQMTLDRDGGEDLLRRMAAGGQATVTYTALAAMGRRHALVRLLWRSERPRERMASGLVEVEVVQVLRTDAGGRAERMELFDGAHLHVALARLFEMHAEDELLPERQAAQAIIADQLREQRNGWSDDAILADHRPASLGTLQGRDAILGAAATLRDLTADLKWQIVDVLGCTERAVVAMTNSEGHREDGGLVQFSTVVVAQFGDDGSLCREDWYSTDQADEALARLDETADQSPAVVVRRRVRPNLATNVPLSPAVNDDTIAYWASRFADDMVSVDHRFHLTGGRASLLAVLRGMAQAGDAKFAPTPLASLGQRHALVRWNWTSDQPGGDSGPAELGILHVWRTDGAGRILRTEIFDDTNLNLALARLIEMHAEDELVLEQRAPRILHAAQLRDHRVRWSDDAVVIDHRPASLGALDGRAAVRRASDALSDLAADLSWRVVDVLGWAEDAHFVEIMSEGHDQEGGVVQFPVVCVLQVDDDGLTSAVDWYSPEQIDEAMARFDELTSPADVVRRRAALLTSALPTGDWAPVAAQFGEGFVWDDRRKIVGGLRYDAAGAIEHFKFQADTGMREVLDDVVASRGERLTLMHEVWRGPDIEGAVLVVMETDAEGRWCSFISFDPDDFDTAFDELDRRYLAGEGAAHAETLAPWLAFLKAYEHNDPVGLRQTLSEGVEVVDHRPSPALYGDVHGPDEFVAAVLSVHEVAQDVRGRVLLYNGIVECGAACQLEVRGANSEGGPFELGLQIVYATDGGLTTWMEIFAVDERDAAIARLEELSGREDTGELTNLASRSVAKVIAAIYREQDFDTLSSLTHPDIFFDDRRSLIRMQTHGREEYLELSRGSLEIGVRTLPFVPIAVRGDRLVLWDGTFTGDDFEIPVLGVCEFDSAGRFLATVLFDPNDLDSAFDELDRRYLAGDGADYADTLAPLLSLAKAFERNDPVGCRQLLSDGYEVVEHRPLPSLYADLHGPDEFVAAVLTLHQVLQDMRLRMSCIDAINSAGLAYRLDTRGLNDEGGEVENPMRVLCATDRGLVTRMESFAIDERDAAVARLRELTQPPAEPSGEVLTNLAHRTMVRAFRLVYREHDWDSYISLLHRNYVLEDRRSVIGGLRHEGREAAVEVERTRVAMGVTDAPLDDVVAVRGEHLVLAHILGGGADFEIEALLVVEVDPEGWLLAAVLFDPDDIDASFDELDRRYLAGEGAEYADTLAPVLSILKAYERNDLAGLRQTLSESFEVVDHRAPPALFADVHEPDEFAAAVLTVHHVMHNVRFRIVRIDAVNSAGCACRLEVTGSNSEGGAVEIPLRPVCTIDRGLITRMESFAVDERDAAVARLHELTRPQAEPSGEVLTNLACHTLSSLVRLADYERDWDSFALITHPDAVLDDRRRLVGGLRYEGREDVISVAQSRVAIGVSDAIVEPIAVRGERLVLARDLRQGPDFEIELLDVLEVDPAGRYLAVVFFDPEDLDAAFDELDRRYLAGEGAPFAGTLAPLFSLLKAYERNDPVGCRQLLSDGYKVVDHRPPPALFADLQGPDDHVAALLTVHQVMQNARLRILSIDAITTAGVAVRADVRGLNHEEGDVEIPMRVITTTDRDLITRMESFAVDDRERAIARLYELTRPATEPSGGALTNLAHQTFSTILGLAYHDQDWEAFASLTHPDMFLDDRRRLVGGLHYAGRENVIPVAQSRSAIGVSNALVDPIAVRGERLVLARCLMQGADFEIELVGVIEVDPAGMYLAAVVFDPEDLDAAFEELDRRHLAGEGAPFHDILAVSVAAIDALNRADRDAFRQSFADTFEVVDHRRDPTVYRGVHGPDEYVAAIWSAFEVAERVRGRILRYHAVREGGLAYQLQLSTTTAYGAETETEAQLVATVEDARVTRNEIFPLHELSTALARFEELTAAPSAALVRPNAASKMTERFLSRGDAGDVDGEMALLAPDSVFDDRRPGLRTRMERPQVDEHLRLLAELFQFRPTVHSLVATRGDRLALYHLVYRGSSGDGGEAEVAALSIYELRDDGLGKQMIMFAEDDLDAAYDELDQLYVAGEAAPFAAQWNLATAFLHSVRVQDWAAVRGLLSSDFILSDRFRVSVFGQLDGERWIEWMTVLRSQVPDVRTRIVCVHRVDGGGAVAAMEYAGRDSDGGEISAPFIAVVVMDSDAGTLTRFEPFDPENLDAALARFDELIAERGSRVEVGPLDEAYESTLAPAEAEVWRASEQLVRNYNERDWEALRALLDPDAVIVDERMTGWGRIDRDQLIIHLGQLVGLVGDAQLKVAGVHLISPNGLAARFEVTGTVPGGGEFEMDFETATTVEHGRIVGFDMFPEGDVAEVTRRLG